MSDKELYQQKIMAQLDEWKADVTKLKSRASVASADAKLQLDRQVRDLEAKIGKGKVKLTEIANTSEEVWGSVKEGFKSAWDTLKSGVKGTETQSRK